MRTGQPVHEAADLEAALGLSLHPGLADRLQQAAGILRVTVEVGHDLARVDKPHLDLADARSRGVREVGARSDVSRDPPALEGDAPDDQAWSEQVVEQRQRSASLYFIARQLHIERGSAEVETLGVRAQAVIVDPDGGAIEESSDAIVTGTPHEADLLELVGLALRQVRGDETQPLLEVGDGVDDGVGVRVLGSLARFVVHGVLLGGGGKGHLRAYIPLNLVKSQLFRCS